MSDVIAHGVVEIEVNDAAALAKLRSVRDGYQRTMREIDAMEADVEIGADDAELKDAVANAKRRVRELDGMKADVTIDTNSAEFKREMAEARALVKMLDGQKAVIEMEVHGDREVASQIKKLEQLEDKRHQARVKLANEEAAIADRQFKASLNQANRESKVRESLHRQRLREFSEDEKAAHRMNAAMQKAHYDSTVGVLKQKAEVLKLQREYAKLTDRVEHLNRKQRGTFGRENKAKVELDTAEAVAKMAALKATLNAMGEHPPVHINVDARFSRAGLANASRNMMDKLGSVLNASTRIGPFTTSLKNVLTLGLALSPVITDIVGALGALGGVAGSAAVGLGALGAGVIGGFAPAMLGLGLVIKGVATEWQNVQKAQKAYDDAVRKGNTDLAKKKMKELQATMGNVSKETVQQIGNWRKLSKAFTEATQPARAAVWTTIGEGIKSANALLPMFTRNTNEFSKTAARGVQEWMRGLRSGAGQNALNEMMKNATASLGPLLHGLGQVGAYLGRVGQVASRALPGMARQFSNWADKLFNTTKADDFVSKIDNVIESVRSVGRFLLSGGRLMKAFFGGGVREGQRFLDVMTNAMNGWTDFLESAQGQKSLGKFFHDGVEGARSLFNAIAPLGAAFVEFAGNLSPILTAFLQGAGYISKFVAEITRLTGMTGALTALAFTFGGMFAVARIAAFASMLARVVGLMGQASKLAAAGNLSGAFGAMAQAGTRRGAGRAVGAAETVAADAPMLVGRTGRAAGGAAREVGVFRAAATKLIPAIATLGTLAGGVATAGVVALGAAALYGGYKLLTMKSAHDKLTESMRQNAKESRANVQVSEQNVAGRYQEGQAMRSLQDQVGRTVALKKRLSDLDAAGKRNTDEYRAALDAYTQAYNQRTVQEQSAAKLRDESNRRETIALDNLGKVNKARNEQAAAQKRVNDAEKEAETTRLRQGTSMNSPADAKRIAEAKRDEAAATAALKQRQAEYQQVLANAAVAQANYQRGIRNMPQLAGAAAAALGRLAIQNKKVASSVATKFVDPGDVKRVSNAASGAIKSGAKQKVVIDIVANSKNAEQAIRRLTAIKDIRKNVTIAERGGSAAVSMLERINGKKLTRKQQQIATSGGPRAIALLAQIIGIKIPGKKANVTASTAAAIAAINQVLGMNIPDKSFNVIGRLIMPALPSHINVAGGQHTKATGRGPSGGRYNSLIGEGNNFGGAAELLANRRTGVVTRINGPTLANLSPDDYVIPIEENLSNGRRLMQQFARDMGMMRFAGGKKPKQKSLSNAEKAKARAQARVNVTKNAKPVKYSTNNAIELSKVTNAQRTENNLRDQVMRQQSQLDAQEPASFLTQTGTTPDGQPIYAVDQAGINAWSAKLEAMAQKFDALVTAIMATLTAVNAAIRRIGDIGDPSRLASLKDNSVIGRANKNMDVLAGADGKSGLMGREKRVINSKRASLHERQRAQERYNVYKSAYQDAMGTRSGAFSDWQTLEGERNDIGDDTRGRIAEAKDAAAQIRADAGAIQGKAAADAAASQPSVQNTDPYADLAGAAEAYDAQSALLSIGQNTMSADAIAAGRKATGQSYIDRAKAFLADADTTNDSAAYQAIQTGAGLLGGGSAGDNFTTSAQTSAFNQARYDLFNSMGSNFSLAGNFGATNRAFGGGARGPSIGSPNTGSTGGGVVVENLNATFPVQPSDPHTFSKGLAYELQASL